jgi:hypothetical protein
MTEIAQFPAVAFSSMSHQSSTWEHTISKQVWQTEIRSSKGAKEHCALLMVPCIP